MRRTSVGSVLGVAVLLLLLPMCSAAGAAPANRGFVDEFTSFDTSRWSVAAPHTLGRGRIDPTNTSVTGGHLLLGLRSGSLDGAEVRSTGQWDGGVFRARLQVANAPSSLTGFFLYSPPDYAHEIDIELYNSRDGRILLTTHDAGATTHTTELRLPFDPTADVHEYTIATKGHAVEFSVDGVVLQTWADGAPRAPMNLYANVWFPQWLAGTAPTSPQRTSIDSISVTAR